MRSFITNYAIEEKTDGVPNHHFYLSKDGIQSVSHAIVETHFLWSVRPFLRTDQIKKDNYALEQISKLLTLYDVLNEGLSMSVELLDF